MKDYWDYRRIQREKQNGSSKLSTSLSLGISRGTVQKYWDMEEESFISRFHDVRRIEQMNHCLGDVMVYMRHNRNASARRIHEYLAQCEDGVNWSARTTARFVRNCREEYGMKR